MANFFFLLLLICLILTVREAGKPELKSENMKQIHDLVTKKSEDRIRYELFQQYKSNEMYVGIWINVLQKCGFRLMPIEFEMINLKFEIPRLFLGQTITIRCTYTKNDWIPESLVNQRYMTLVTQPPRPNCYF